MSSSSTDPARSGKVPPVAISWLSWYWAKSASASRWASSNARVGRARARRCGPAARPRPAGAAGQPSAIARSSSTHDTAPGSRWPIERSPSRSARPRRATSGRVHRIPRAAARTAAPMALPGDPPLDVASMNVSAAGRRASRIVLSPTAHRPRRARPSAAAASIGPSAAGPGTGHHRPWPPPRGTLCRTGARTPRRRRPPADDRRPGAARRGASSGGQVLEHRLDGPEADHEVVAVVAVAEDRVEPGQVGGVPLDDDPASAERRADAAASMTSWRGADGRRTRSADDSPSTAPGNAPAGPAASAPGWRPSADLLTPPCFLLDDLGRRIASDQQPGCNPPGR